METRSFQRVAMWVLLILFGAGGLLPLVVPDRAEAIPAWTRKYNADCSLCHYPSVPRLNALGQRFRRAGYRMPDEFGKAQEITQVGNFLAVRGRGRYEFVGSKLGDNSSEFQWHDSTIFYSGALTKNISAFTEVEWEAPDDFGLVAQIQGMIGSPDQFGMLRVGQIHTLVRVGAGGFDRPTGISTPAIFSMTLTRDGVPFKIIEFRINKGTLRYLIHGKSAAWMQDQRSFWDRRMRCAVFRSRPLSFWRSVGALFDSARSAWFQTYSAGLSSGA